MTPFSTVVSFFAIVFIASSVSVVGGDDNNENVKKVCIDIPFPDTCVSTLSRYNRSNTDARTMAGLMVSATMRSLTAAASVAGVQYIDHEDLSDEDSLCFTSCKYKFRKAHTELEVAYGDVGNITDAKLADLHKFLDESKKTRTEWNCDICRHGEMKKKVDEISIGNEAEKNMAILSVLVDRATKK